MNSEIIDAIVSVTYGNLYIKQGSLPDFFHKLEPFKDVASRVYIQKKGLFQKEKVIAKNVYDWLGLQKRNKAKRFHLIYFPNPDGKLSEHIATAFASSGGFWLIGVETKNKIYIWFSKRNYITNKRVNGMSDTDYAGVCSVEMKVRLWKGIHKNDLPPISSVDDCTIRLKAILNELIAFSSSVNWLDWKDHFEKTVACFSEAIDESSVLTNKLIPPGILSDKSVRLLSASRKAWVFGGMGSWNDCPNNMPAFQAEYNRLTPLLYDAVCKGIIAATNSAEGL